MKTLDEVIKSYEYTYENDPIAWTYGVDALHYLKEYREKQKTLEIKEAEYKRGFEQLGVEWSRIKNNPPLTWDELKQMEGKPVWVELNSEYGNFSHWGIIRNFLKIGCEFEYMELLGYYDIVSFSVIKEYQGKEWQAYRKERKNETD